MKKNSTNKKKQMNFGLIMAIAIGMIVSGSTMFFYGNDIKEVVNPEPKETEMWHVVDVWTATGENDPGFETGGFMSCFLLDYGQVPATVLLNNATDWSASGDVHAYADSDDWSEDTPSEDPFYVVVRACFTQAQAGDGGEFNGSRCRCTLTASGDETISQTVVCNGTAETYGGGIESANDTDKPKLYVNFWFDDNDDGYRLTDDGSLTISSIVIEAKY